MKTKKSLMGLVACVMLLLSVNFFQSTQDQAPISANIGYAAAKALDAGSYAEVGASAALGGMGALYGAELGAKIGWVALEEWF